MFTGAAFTRFADGRAELRWRDGRVDAFNSYGYLVEQRDRDTNRVQIVRDGSTARILELIAPSGRKFTFTYVSVIRGHLSPPWDVIASITDPLGRTVRYGYYAGSNGRLTAVTDPAGGVTRYTYGAYAQTYLPSEGLLTITDPKGLVYLTHTYDANGRVATQTLADGGTYTFTYTLAGQTVTQTSVTDPRSFVSTHRFNAGQCVTQLDRPGPSGTLTTTFERTTGTNALTAVVDPLGRRTEYTYDASGNVATLKDPETHTTTFTYEATYNRLATLTDPLSHVTTFTYNDTARTTTITDPAGKATVIQTTAAGQPTTLTDPLTHATTFTYDAHGNLSTTVDALGQTTTRWYDAASRLLALADPRGALTRFTYDDLNRVTESQDAAGGLTRFTYDGNGNLLTVTDAKTQTTTYTYDVMDRLLTRTETAQYDKHGNLNTITDSKNQTATFTYDSLNRRTQRSLPPTATMLLGGSPALGIGSFWPTTWCGCIHESPKLNAPARSWSNMTNSGAGPRSAPSGNWT